jgi:hypothetical protein
MLNLWQEILRIFKFVQAPKNSWGERFACLQLRRVWEVLPSFGPAEASCSYAREKAAQSILFGV